MKSIILEKLILVHLIIFVLAMVNNDISKYNIQMFQRKKKTLTGNVKKVKKLARLT